MTTDYRYWEVRLVVAIPSEHDVSGVDVILDALQLDVETIVLDTSEKEMTLVKKGEEK